jgi:hypothetical protein
MKGKVTGKPRRNAHWIDEIMIEKVHKNWKERRENPLGYPDIQPLDTIAQESIDHEQTVED